MCGYSFSDGGFCGSRFFSFFAKGGFVPKTFALALFLSVFEQFLSMSSYDLPVPFQRPPFSPDRPLTTSLIPSKKFSHSPDIEIFR